MRRLYIDFDGVVLNTIPMLYAALEASGADTKVEKEEFNSIEESYGLLEMSTVSYSDGVRVVNGQMDMMDIIQSTMSLSKAFVHAFARGGSSFALTMKIR